MCPHGEHKVQKQEVKGNTTFKEENLHGQHMALEFHTQGIIGILLNTGLKDTRYFCTNKRVISPQKDKFVNINLVGSISCNVTGLVFVSMVNFGMNICK